MSTWKTEDSSTIYYEFHDSGHADVLILLHGMLGSIEGQWGLISEWFIESHNLLLVDLRDHGRSTNEDTRLRPDQMVADLLGLLDHLGIQNSHIAGYSIGGLIALHAALQTPNRFKTLQMIATKFYWSEKTIAKLQQQVDPELLSEKAPTYATQLAQEHGANQWRGLARHTADLIGYFGDNPLSPEALGGLKMPVQITVGDRDDLVSLPEAFKLSRQFKNGGLLVLPRTPHAFKFMQYETLIPSMQMFHK